MQGSNRVVLEETRSGVFRYQTVLDIVTAELQASVVYCQRAKGLLEALAGVIHELIKIHEQQFRAVIEGDPNSSRFDDMIKLANKRKLEAKYEYLQHLSAHRCSTLR
jgi:hypothetical protein